LGSWTTHLDPRAHLALMRLAGDGAPLGEPWIAPVCAEAADQDPNLLVLASGRVLLTSFGWNPMAVGALALPGFGARGPEGVGQLHAYYFQLWGCNARCSDDGGANFSPPTYFPEGPRPSVGGRGGHAGALRGRAVCDAGVIYQATYLAPGEELGALGAQLFVSDNDGASFTWRSTLMVDRADGYAVAEPSLYRSPDGVLFAFLRTSRSDDAIVVLRSHDDGFSWGEPEVSEVFGHPLDPLPLADGSVLLTYGYRHPPFGVRARLWDGRDPSLAGDEVIVREDGRSPDLGYPWAEQLGDGSVLISYYFHDDEGIRSIVASRLDMH
jgi:hypothetical protein